jgi:uncharacterized protein (TIGR03086 family)
LSTGSATPKAYERVVAFVQDTAVVRDENRSMTEISDRYRANSERFLQKVAAVPPDTWDRPTPCDEWTVRDLVAHIIQTQGMFLGFIGRSLTPGPDVAVDPLGAVTAAIAQVQKDLDDPETAGAEFDGFFGRSTFAQAVDRFLNFDLTVHGWDLARAAGLDDTIDPAELDRVSAAADGFGDNLHSPGVCGPEIAVPDDADPQTKLLARLGRAA